MTRTELITKLRQYEDTGFGPDYSILCQAADMLEADGKPLTDDRDDLIALLKEARKIIRASAHARSSHSDWLNRTKDIK